MMTDEARAQIIVDNWISTGHVDTPSTADEDALVNMIAAAFAAMREECAKVAEDVGRLKYGDYPTAKNIAAAIRTGPSRASEGA